MESNNTSRFTRGSRRLRRRVLAAASLIGIGLALPASARAQVLPAAAATQSAGATGGAQPPVLLVLGDSLSAEYGIRRGAGWVSLLEEKLARNGKRYNIVNASISGETTSGGRARIDDLLKRHRPSVVVIELGGNDALRGLDLNASERNLSEMVRRSRQAGAHALLLGMMVPPNYGRAYADRFAAIFPRVAKAEQAALVPFFLEGVAQRMDLFQPDRIHPNERAQPMLLENVWPTLATLL